MDGREIGGHHADATSARHAFRVQPPKEGGRIVGLGAVHGQTARGHGDHRALGGCRRGHERRMADGDLDGDAPAAAVAQDLHRRFDGTFGGSRTRTKMDNGGVVVRHGAGVAFAFMGEEAGEPGVHGAPPSKTAGLTR